MSGKRIIGNDGWQNLLYTTSFWLYILDDRISRGYHPAVSILGLS